MTWYLSKLVFRIVCGDGEHVAQFDEQLRLIAAGSKEEAFFKARQIGQQEEDEFYNYKQQMVKWEFINVCQLYKLQELVDGTEVYSKIEERDDAESYIHIVHQKAGEILNREQGVTNDELQEAGDSPSFHHSLFLVRHS